MAPGGTGEVAEKEVGAAGIGGTLGPSVLRQLTDVPGTAFGARAVSGGRAVCSTGTTTQAGALAGGEAGP
jgi:hypothetical protein